MEDRSATDMTAEPRVIVVPDALLDDPDLRGTIAIQVYRELLRKPTSTLREIALTLNCTERTVSRNLDRLEEKGWLSRGQRLKGRPNTYSFPHALGLAG